MPATRRHSVGPPDHDESKLHTSIAPADVSSRHPGLVDNQDMKI